MRVLVVEDDDELRLTLADALRRRGIDVDTAADLPEADRALAAGSYDCVVVERFLPGGDALDHVRTRWAAGWPMPVLFLVEGQAVGLDVLRSPEEYDYLVKPFDPGELVARLHGLSRRAALLAPDVLRAGSLELDLARYQVHRDGVPLTLTSTEFAVLEALMASQDQVVPRAALEERLHGQFDGPALDAVIARLRTKLGPPARIESVRGVGYRLQATPPAETVGEVGTTFPVTIYLGDESGHERVQAAVEDLLDLAGAEIADRDDPVRGSWFRRMRARTRAAATSRPGREAAAAAAHVLDSRLVLAQDATVTATMMQNLGPVLAALHTTKDAVIRVGALLIVKVEWTVAVHQLTAAQQLLLDHHPHLLTSPQEILTALRPDNASDAPPLPGHHTGQRERGQPDDPALPR
ncbi:response regulator transcription factor [Amycolatopsis sacchari]|uniref:DNA-binding response regulator, OmpR family, contains REC and winged-helix (WHTH) domain n=1 Tax=Amycolatopsis sacchari TaxID=115433 RepID=A0A1I4C6M0_9PSEU|nr:response regulator transcription factor [Amycolatopsis sacchari]SFK76260.1 DNA-binding response regulator, OmpR family, contains REC and winged-helix (wHTH) domain [Amycolatopsis sacchari]